MCVCMFGSGGKDKLCLQFIGFHFRRSQIFTYGEDCTFLGYLKTLNWMYWLEGAFSCLLWGGDEYILRVEIRVKCISQKSYSWVEVMWTEVIDATLVLGHKNHLFAPYSLFYSHPGAILETPWWRLCAKRRKMIRSLINCIVQ